MSRTVTMWCPRCELWTKEYDRAGLHYCKTEVISTGDGEQPDLEYEGEVLHQEEEALLKNVGLEKIMRHSFL